SGPRMAGAALTVRGALPCQRACLGACAPADGTDTASTPTASTVVHDLSPTTGSLPEPETSSENGTVQLGAPQGAQRLTGRSSQSTHSTSACATNAATAPPL